MVEEEEEEAEEEKEKITRNWSVYKTSPQPRKSKVMVFFLPIMCISLHQLRLEHA